MAAAISYLGSPLPSPSPSPSRLRKVSVLSSSRFASSVSVAPARCPASVFTSTSLRCRSPGKYRRIGFAVSALKKLSETESVTISSESEGILPSDSGVYAVYDAAEELQFIGITTNLAASVLSHKKSVPDLCISAKLGVVGNQDKTVLTQAWKSWLQEHISATGNVPPGNQQGNTVWVKKTAAPKKKVDLRLTPGRHMELAVPLEELIDRLVKESKVVAFIKGSRAAPLCGFSQRVVAILESQGVEYESVDVLDEEYNYGLRETLKRYSNWPTFPQVFVNGDLVGGCDILTSMYEKGELAQLFK
ncbi:hypothetical protein M569_02889 [Genlisea aurea]|uniref:Glutaredoxin domain-containing protein n=1 Tax=Genlisea aurea TaxID=192259 RepID=S8D3A1_9LAMI|nr:hypothetical protein M569_02889 [Genlisea aurea]